MSAITYLHGVVNEGTFSMWYSCIRRYRNLIGLLGIFSILLGCGSTPKSPDPYMGEGFRTALPKTGTKAVVRGNHSEAVNQALRWLNGHQLLVVNRLVEKESTTPGIPLRERTERQAQVFAMAQKMGATLVVFVQVEDTPVNPTVDPLSVGKQPMNMIGVEIQGMNAETGKVMFGAKAWNSEPLVASEKIVQDLTILALEKAWQAPEGSLPRQQEVTPEINTEQKTPLMAAEPVESPATPTVAQPMPVESPATAQEQVTVLTEPAPEKIPPASAVPQPVAAEQSEATDDPSLGLQIASGALSILYTPVKVVYAGLGGLFGGFVYALTGGNEKVAHSVWDASLRGDYWLTPEHLQGNEPIHFKGEPAH